MRLLILILTLFITHSTMAQFVSYRQLLITNNASGQSLVQQQLRLLDKAAAGVKERDIKVEVLEKENPLMKKYNINTTQFTVVLIGKDGYEKYRTNELLSTDKLFAIIDAMPMRKREMRNND